MKKWLVLPVLLLIGCVGAPIDTVNKRLAVFEIGYAQTLETVQLWINEGRLTGIDKGNVQNIVKDMSTARVALYLAKDLGDLKTVDGQLKAANMSLTLLRSYLSNKEKVP